MIVMKKMKELLWIPVIVLLVWGAMTFYKAPKHAIGSEVADFVGYLPDGDSIRLSDFEGNIILLDFWGSWCGPCRQQNPMLVKLYHKYKDKNFGDGARFDIISIAMETRKSSWLNAIAQDKMVWKNHVSDINRMKDHVADLYGVKEIPTTYLLDKNHKVIAVNLSEAGLDAKLASLMTD